MSKILIVYDSIKFDDNNTQYAIEIAKSHKGMLVGVFLKDLDVLYKPFMSVYDTVNLGFPVATQEDITRRKELSIGMNLFKGACEKAGIRYKIHLDMGTPILDLVRETLFADLLIIDKHTGFYVNKNEASNIFLKDILSGTQCPVLVLPEKYEGFRRAVITYDGSHSSIYAFKLFSYLFPESYVLPADLVTVNPNEKINRTKRNIGELMSEHFSDVSYNVLNGDAENELYEYIYGIKESKPVVIMGAYGRGTYSRLFVHSRSDKILKDLDVPVFIAHL